MSSKQRKCRAALHVEELESRYLLSWAPTGPAPVKEEQQGILAPQDASGRVTALAFDPNFDGKKNPALFLGAASGGIWRTTDFKLGTNQLNDNPKWVSVSDDGTNRVKLPTGAGAATASGLIDIGTIAVDPNNGQIIYAGTGEANNSGDSRYGNGILRSTGGGAPGTWDLISQGKQPDGHLAFARESFSKIIVDPTVKTGKTLFAAVVPVGQGGFDAKTDKDLGVYRSTDGGITWEKLKLQTPDTPLIVTDLDYNIVLGPSTGPTLNEHLILYAAVGNPNNENPGSKTGVYTSSNGGTTWTRLPFPDGLPNDPTKAGRIALAADHRPGQFLVDVIVSSVKKGDTTTTPMLTRVYSSADLGRSWTNITPQAKAGGPGTKVDSVKDAFVLGDGGSYDLSAILVPDVGNPKASPVLYVGGRGTESAPVIPGVIFYDGKQWWSAVPTTPKAVAPHVDHHAFAAGGGVVYDGNDGGIYKFNPSARTPPGTWTNLNNNLNTIQVNGVASDNDVLTKIYLLEGSQDNGLALSQGYPFNDLSWKWRSPFGDAGRVRFASDLKTAYAVNGSSSPHLYRSTDWGQTWKILKDLPADTSGYPFSPLFAVSPSNPNKVLFASNKSLYLITPTGSTAITAGRLGGTVKALDTSGGTITAVAWADDAAGLGTVYAGTSNGQLWQITGLNKPGSVTFTRLDQAPRGRGPRWGDLTITDILVDPRTITDPTKNDVFITLSGFDANNKVWNSTNGGKTWKNADKSHKLPNVPINTVALDSSKTGRWGYYVGTDVGIYYQTYGGAATAWVPFNDKLPLVQVTDLSVYGPKGKPTGLFAGTHGRGVY